MTRGVAWRVTKLPAPHDFDEGDTPGVCRWCPLPSRHQTHDPVKAAQHRAALAARQQQAGEIDRRRTGESTGDDPNGTEEL